MQYQISAYIHTYIVQHPSSFVAFVFPVICIVFSKKSGISFIMWEVENDYLVYLDLHIYNYIDGEHSMWRKVKGRGLISDTGEPCEGSCRLNQVTCIQMQVFSP